MSDDGEERADAPSNEKRVKFGSRYLTDKEKVFEFNAWDDVEWTDEHVDKAMTIVAKQAESQLPETKREELEEHAGLNWDKFYSQHENRFFKDRNWLFIEFPELFNGCDSKGEAHLEIGQGAAVRVLEVGCGVGNTAIPILKSNTNPDTFVYACDIAPTAVELLKAEPEYSQGRALAFVHDMTSDDALPIPDGSLDICIMIFVLSAMHPSKFPVAVAKLAKALKPGGLLVYRDYGRYDLTQLRFKTNRFIEENFYMRGDGTRVYFSTKEEMHEVFTAAGLVCEENGYDKRLIVNRKRELQMYRCWLQCKYRKPNDGTS